MSVAAPAEHDRPGANLAGPYIGLVPYDEGDAPLFFGRSQETAFVAANFRAARMTVVYGPSGVGKSSLLMAGVVHGMREEGRGADDAPSAVCTFRLWRDDPLPGLRETCRLALQESAGDKALADVASGATLAEALAEWTAQAGTLYLVLDQFEEYLQYHPASGSDDLEPGFETEYAQLVDDPSIAVHVLLSIREDAWAGLDRFEGHVPGLFANYLRIDHLDIAAGREAITGPIAAWNDAHGSEAGVHEIEPALVDAVIEAAVTSPGLADTAGAEIPANAASDRVEAPFLQLVMERVWRATVAAGVDALTLDRLVELGGARRIVARHLDDALGKLTREERDVASDCFAFLVSRSRTKVAHPAGDLADWTRREEPDVVDVVEKLCTADGGRILRKVSPGASDERRAAFELYHDVLAEPVLAWRLVHQQARNRRRLVRIGGILVGLVAVFATLTTWALIEKHTAEAAARDTQLLAGATTAQALATTNLAESLKLSLALMTIKDTPDARSAMTLGLQAAHASGVRKLLTGHVGAVNALALSGTGSTLVSGGADGTVRVWSVAGGGQQIARASTNSGSVSSVGIDETGDTIASADQTRAVQLWKADPLRKSGTPLRVPPSAVATGVSLSSDGHTLAVGDDTGAVHAWNVLTRKEIGERRVDRDGVTQVLFSPEGDAVASVGQSGTVSVLTVGSSSLRVASTACRGAHVSQIAYSSDGRRLVCGDMKGRVRFWDVNAEQWKGPTLSTGGVELTSVSLSADSRWLAATGRDGGVRIWDLHRKGATPQELGSVGESIRSVRFGGANGLLAGAAFDGTIFVWDVGGQAPTRVPQTGRRVRVVSVAYNPAASMVAGAGRYGAVGLWAGHGRTTSVRTLETASDRPVTDIDFSGDGRVLAAVGEDGVLHRWRAGGRGERDDFRLAVGVGVPVSMSLSRDGRFAAVAGDRGKVEVLDCQTGRPRALVAHPHVTSVAIAPDSGVLATAGSDGTLRLWDIGGSVPRQTTARRVDPVDSLAISRDGHTIATGSSNGVVQLWGIGDAGRLDAQWSAPAHGGDVSGVAFNPSGLTLATAGRDGVIRLWDVSDGQQLGEPMARSGGDATSVSTGRSDVAASYADGSLLLWTGITWFDDASLTAQVCRLVGSDLGPTRWMELVPKLHYVAPCGP